MLNFYFLPIQEMKDCETGKDSDKRGVQLLQRQFPLIILQAGNVLRQTVFAIRSAIDFMKFLFGTVISAEHAPIERFETAGTNIVIAIWSIDAFKFIPRCHFSAFPALLAAIIAIVFFIKNIVICNQIAAIEAAAEFLPETVRADLHGFPILIHSLQKICGLKFLMTAVTAQKIIIPAIAAHQMSMEFNCIIFSYVFTAVRTNEVTLACAPDAHGILVPGIDKILTGKILTAAFAFFVCFMNTILAYADSAPFDEMHFPFCDSMTTSAFAHDITSRISFSSGGAETADRNDQANCNYCVFENKKNSSADELEDFPDDRRIH